MLTPARAQPDPDIYCVATVGRTAETSVVGCSKWGDKTEATDGCRTVDGVEEGDEREENDNGDNHAAMMRQAIDITVSLEDSKRDEKKQGMQEQHHACGEIRGGNEAVGRNYFYFFPGLGRSTSITGVGRVGMRYWQWRQMMARIARSRW